MLPSLFDLPPMHSTPKPKEPVWSYGGTYPRKLDKPLETDAPEGDLLPGDEGENGGVNPKDVPGMSPDCFPGSED